MSFFHDWYRQSPDGKMWGGGSGPTSTINQGLQDVTQQNIAQQQAQAAYESNLINQYSAEAAAGTALYGAQNTAYSTAEDVAQTAGQDAARAALQGGSGDPFASSTSDVDAAIQKQALSAVLGAAQTAATPPTSPTAPVMNPAASAPPIPNPVAGQTGLPSPGDIAGTFAS